MPPQARVPPASRHPVFIWPTPEEQDTLFYVERDATLPKNQEWTYGEAYFDAEAYPNHKLIHVSPQDGRNWSRWYYAADRIDEDEYNWEFTQADLGGRRFDGVRRTYLVPREDFSSTSPAAGAAMPDVPTGKFSGYILATRDQRRTGDDLFDSLYVIEVRTYVARQTITIVKYDATTEGPLQVVETLYYRGENFGTPPVPIETAINTPSYWVPTAGGQLFEPTQLSHWWFLVRKTDLIPQNKTTTGNKFGGKVLSAYDTYITASWPAVLGDDGSLDHKGDPIGDLGFEIMDYEDKDGNFRNYPRPLYEKQHYRGPCRATITEEWSSTKPTIHGVVNSPIILDAKPIVYPSPWLVLRIPPTLHAAIFAQCDTDDTDPVWGENRGSKRTFPATNKTEWPSSYTLIVEVQKFRGGYFTRHVLVHEPDLAVAT